MNKTHTIAEGDTLESISRRYYGTEEETGRITAANPAITDPLTVGAVLNIPGAGTPAVLPPKVQADSISSASITVGGVNFRYFTELTLEFSVDRFSTFSFSAPMEVGNADFRDIFQPLTFKALEAFVGGERVQTGTIMQVSPQIGDRETVTVSGYGSPGVLADCNAQASSFPIEYIGLDLREIAIEAAAPFGLSTVFFDSPGPVFDAVAMRPADKVFAFLTKLAKQRQFLLTDSPDGALLFQKANDQGEIVANFELGSTPGLTVSSAFNPQQFYSSVTGFTAAIAGLPSEKFTVVNPFLQGVNRPYNFSLDDTAPGDIRQAVENKAALMFGNAVSYNVTIPTWTDANGEIFQPNTLVTLLAPEAMVYRKTELLVRAVTLNKSADKLTATLNLVLPGTFTGKIPEGVPWQR